MALQAGQLNQRVTIQTVTLTSDAGGGSTEAWADTVTVWARVEALTGGEAWQAMQVAANLSHRVTIRKRAVTAQQRVKYGTDILLIRSVRPDEHNVERELLCEQVNI